MATILSVWLLESSCAAKTSTANAVAPVCAAALCRGLGVVAVDCAVLSSQQNLSCHNRSGLPASCGWRFNLDRAQDRMEDLAAHAINILDNTLGLWFRLLDRLGQILESLG